MFGEQIIQQRVITAVFIKTSWPADWGAFGLICVGVTLMVDRHGLEQVPVEIHQSVVAFSGEGDE
jgi:hypothetical protein